MTFRLWHHARRFEQRLDSVTCARTYPLTSDSHTVAVMISYRRAFNGQQPTLILAFAAMLTAMVFVLQGNQGFELWDEGYLWYGAQRVLHGETPLLDFMSYDPGRYYWSAAWMRAWGDTGILALRASAAVFQGIGLAIGLRAISLEAKRGAWPLIGTAAIVLTAWMYPAFKVFDVACSIALVSVYSALIRTPSAKRYVLAGIAVGLAAFVGRNHGVYGVFGGILILFFLARYRTHGPTFLWAAFYWGAGIVIGYLPILIMLALISGFPAAFLESILFIIHTQTTNLALPIPWPWSVQYDSLNVWEGVRAFILGCLFIAVLLFSVWSILSCVVKSKRLQPVSPLFAASAAMSLPYAHYAFSRADVVHLSQGIMPFLLGCFAWIAIAKHSARWFAAAALLITSLIIMFPIQPGWQCHISPSCVNGMVGSDRLKIEQGAVNDLAMIDALRGQYAPSGQTFITVPFWPGAYAAFETKSPMWEIYALFPRDKSFQKQEIERIRTSNPGFVLILDIAIDGNEQTRFRNSHPLLFDFIESHFEPMAPYNGNPAYKVYRRRQQG